MNKIKFYLFILLQTHFERIWIAIGFKLIENSRSRNIH